MNAAGVSTAAEIGLGLQSDKRPGEYARLARCAEEYGFDVVSVFSDLMFQPPIVALLEIAQATRRVRLGAACWNPFTMHPYEIAGQLAALDAASGGRAYLGLARGAWLDRLGLAPARPVDHLAQAVALIRALVEGEGGGVDADLYPLAAGTRLRYERPERMPPILIGTWGERTAALAGRIADEVKVGGTANPAMVAVMRGWVRVGAERAARDPRDIGITVGAVTVVDEDGEAARRLARHEVAMYLAVVAGLDPTLDLDPDLLAHVTRLVDAGDHAGAGATITDDVLDLFAFSGTPEQVAGQAQKLIDAGVRRVEFGTPHGLTAARGVDLLGRRVLPLLSRTP